MKKILETLKIKWAEYLLEILVVTIGILGAFVLNNWNENRLNREEEYRILLDLKKEFQKNKESAETKLNLNKKSNRAAYHLMKLNSEGILFDDMDRTDSLLAVAISWASFDAQMGVTNELINAGKISLIRDQNLKNKLTGWSSQLMNSQEDYKARADYWITVMMPYLGRHFNLAHLDNYVDWEPWDKEYNTQSYRSSFRPNMKMDPLVFENLMWTFKYNNDYVIIDETSLKVYIDETLNIIERNLEHK